MIDRLIEFSVRRRFWVLAGAAAWAAFGLWAVQQTPIDAVPDLSENQVLVSADWPGHGPVEVERHVTYPLSLAFQQLQGLQALRGSSDVGSATLWLIFDDDLSFEEARRRAQNLLASLPPELPAGVQPRLAADGIPTGQIFWYTLEGGGLDLGELRALQDWSIAPQLRSLPGVAEVASVGGFVREIHVDVDPAELFASGLALRDVSGAIEAARSAVGGHVVHKGNAEYLVQVGGGASGEDASSIDAALARLKELVIPSAAGTGVRLGDVARVRLGAAARRGLFEKDGNEVVGGVVHLRYGHNVLEVTQRVKSRLRELESGLPPGVRLRPCYDRTPLIRAAVGTVTRTLVEAILVASVCVVLVMRHARAALAVAVTLPLAVLGAFAGMWLLRAAGVADIQTNIMSLAGLVVSVGVLVDSSIVLTENVMHHLRRRFGDKPVTGNVDETVVHACQSVGRPVFASILIMLVSFLPVFALGGIDGRMYSPLAWTKTLALVGAAGLAVMLVPALCGVLVRGRIRDESASWIVRSVVQVYRPVLSMLLDRPAPLVWLLSLTCLLAAAALGLRWLLLGVLAVGLVLSGMAVHSGRWRAAAVGSLLLAALFAEQQMRPLGSEIRLPLDEGMVMDMPITVPRASITQAGDDLKARNMVLCRFPEIHMVVGKAGRAETPFDPAPIDMIETMIEFRPRDWWPRRRLLRSDAERHARAAWNRLTKDGLVRAPAGIHADAAFLAEAVEAGLLKYDAVLREVCHQQVQQFLRSLSNDLARRLVIELAEHLDRRDVFARRLTDGDVAALQQGLPGELVAELAWGPSADVVAPLVDEVLRRIAAGGLLRPARGAAPRTGDAPSIDNRVSADRTTASIAIAPRLVPQIEAAVQTEYERLWAAFLPRMNAEVTRRAPRLWTRIISEELITRAEVLDPSLAEVLRQGWQVRFAPPPVHDAAAGHEHTAMAGLSELPLIDPYPAFDAVQRELAAALAGTLRLKPHDPESLAGFGGEMDRALQMPGWTNVWTRPIQNRVDMLATGVNAEVGVRVLGRDLDSVVDASERIAEALRELPGAADVLADPVRGKGYLRVAPDPARAAELGVSLGELNELLEASLSGRIVTHELHGRERMAVRLRCAPADVLDEQSLARLQVPVRRLNGPSAGSPAPAAVRTVTLDSVAAVEIDEGPTTIKSEGGWLRNYVRLNVRGRDPAEFVAAARRVVSQLVLPPGVFVEWTGQYEHAARARQKLLTLMPIVFGLILCVLFLVYRDWADTLLVVLAVPCALAGGVLCQWLLGYPFSIAVGMGYIACFGMAAATGIVMLVYLREAVERAGGLERMSESDLRQAVLAGAVHRLRPKLLTEATTVLALMPILWSTGVGSEVIRPMAAPVLGGILVADEVIDLLLPVLFFRVRRWRWRRLHGLPATPPTVHTPGAVLSAT